MNLNDLLALGLMVLGGLGLAWLLQRKPKRSKEEKDEHEVWWY